MAIRMSTGLRAAMLTNYGLERMMRYGHIRVYSGVQPDSADLDVNGSLLAIISTDGVLPQPGTDIGGLQMEISEFGDSLSMAGQWMIKGTASGHAGWWRFVASGENGEGYSPTAPRIDGVVGESLLLNDTFITLQTDEVVDGFFLYFPAE